MKLHDRDNRNTFQSEKKLNTYLIMCLVTTRHHSGLDMGALQASVVTFVIQSKIMEITKKYIAIGKLEITQLTELLKV